MGVLAVLFLTLPAGAAAYQARLILSVQAGTCALRLEADDEARSLRLRVLPDNPRCRPAREVVVSFLKDAFARLDPPRPEGTYTSLYLGRLVDFPWLCNQLASTAYSDPAWDRGRGKPVGSDINRYVAALLSRPDVTAQLAPALEGGGYRVRAATVEKVLVGGFRDVPGYEGPPRAGKVPYDAQVWFRLEPLFRP
jgi:hypothetical protein